MRPAFDPPFVFGRTHLTLCSGFCSIMSEESKMKKILLGVLFVSFMASTTVRADRYDRRWHQAHWGEGHWIHDRHSGRLGWWWVIGDDWHFYTHPVAQPQMVIIQQPAPVPMMAQPQVIQVQQAPPPAPMMAAPALPPVQVTPTMYYCKATETYYPQTMSCPNNAWTPITAGQPPAP